MFLSIYRGYYTVARRYEFYFRVAKQYCFCHEKIKFISSSRRVMFFLLYRQNHIDKIIEENYQNYVIDKLTCEIMENKPLGSWMSFLWILWVVYFPVKHSCLYDKYIYFLGKRRECRRFPLSEATERGWGTCRYEKTDNRPMKKVTLWTFLLSVLRVSVAVMTAGKINISWNPSNVC